MDFKHQIALRIQEAERPFLICHFTPDGDALGSMLGLSLALQKINKQPSPACQDPVPTIYHYLHGAGTVLSQPNNEYDLIISLDCSDARRMGTPYQTLSYRDNSIPIINIDHHITNTNFGQLNWVDTTAVATAEIVLELLEIINIPLDPDIATCLLTGLVSDTRGFRTSNVSSKVMIAATKLMEAGASLAEITNRVFSHRPLAAVLVWAKALPEVCLDGRILWSVITQEMREQSGYEHNGDAGLVSFMSDVNEADMAVVFTERKNNEIDVSMRANQGWDVSQVALSFGGGGHPQASGCTLKTSLHKAIDTILPLLQEAWDKQANQ